MLPLNLQNNLSENQPENTYNLSYHVHSKDGKIVQFDNKRFKIPGILWRKKTKNFKIPIFFSIEKPGQYVIEFDLVKEGAFWGSQKGWKTLRISLELKDLFSDQFKEKYLKTIIKTNNQNLTKEQYLLRLTLKNSELFKDGKLFGFSAGTDYPQIWIRDTATFTSLALLHYPQGIIKNMVEQFFIHQQKSGEIPDNISIDGKTGKNTIETDQESSLIISTYEIFKKDISFVDKKINNISIINRMELALNWVYSNKLNQKYQLIKSGFTADWGDVGKDYNDSRAMLYTRNTTEVLGIYTQAKYIQAINKFLKILLKKKNPEAKINLWQKRLKILKEKTREHLFLKTKGYFISHLVPESDQYFNMEKEMLAVGGNAEAIIAGLMQKSEIKKFISILNAKKKQFSLRTVSFTLIPPYPEGFFKYHLMSHPWTYQNGGEWDWIGGRVINALFLNGFFEEGEKYLLEIVNKNLKDYNINEWQNREGSSLGADFYTGAAGVIGEAIINGYQ